MNNICGNYRVKEKLYFLGDDKEIASSILREDDIEMFEFAGHNDLIIIEEQPHNSELSELFRLVHTVNGTISGITFDVIKNLIDTKSIVPYNICQKDIFTEQLSASIATFINTHYHPESNKLNDEEAHLIANIQDFIIEDFHTRGLLNDNDN